MLKVFIANLAEYNNGNLVGEWISLPCDSSYLNQQIRKVLSSNDTEDVYISKLKWDGIPLFAINKYDDLQILNAKLFKLKDQSTYQLEAISFLISEEICSSEDLDDCISRSYDVVIHRNKTMTDIAKERLLEMIGMSEVPEFLSNHLDYTSMGEEIRNDGYFIEEDNTIYEYIG